MIEKDAPARVNKPWGYEIWWADTPLYVGKILHIEPGERLSVQYHEAKDETSYLLTGEVLLYKGPSVNALEETRMRPGDRWRNLPGELHALQAVTAADVLEVSTPHLDDVVRVEDRYGREGTSRP